MGHDVPPKSIATYIEGIRGHCITSPNNEETQEKSLKKLP